MHGNAVIPYNFHEVNDVVCDPGTQQPREPVELIINSPETTTGYEVQTRDHDGEPECK